MNDRDLEALLRRHRPVGPPPALREQILRAVDRREPWWWLGAAAALVAITAGTQVAIGSEVDTVTVTLAIGAEASAPDPLLELLGDDEPARQLVLFRRAEQEARRAFEPAPPIEGFDGGGQ